MTEPASAAEDNSLHRRLASEMLARRRLRNQYFDRQAFGEQRWDMMLGLFADKVGRLSVEAASQLLVMPPATTLALARILAGHSLIELGDSDGGWADIPINLSPTGAAKMSAYFTELLKAGMAG